MKRAACFSVFLVLCCAAASAATDIPCIVQEVVQSGPCAVAAGSPDQRVVVNGDFDTWEFGPELVRNGDFEIGATSYWTAYGGQPKIRLAPEAHSGSWAMEVTENPPPGNGTYQSALPIEADKTYFAQSFARSPDVSWLYSMQIYDGVRVTTKTDSTTPNKWGNHTAGCYFPSDATQGVLYLLNGGNLTSGSFLVDDISFKEVWPTGWSKAGTWTSGSYFAFNPVNGTATFVRHTGAPEPILSAAQNMSTNTAYQYEASVGDNSGAGQARMQVGASSVWFPTHGIYTGEVNTMGSSIFYIRGNEDTFVIIDYIRIWKKQ